MKLYFTKHAQKKIKFYRLSKTRLKRVLLNPFRIEEGIAPQTFALMKPTKLKKEGHKKIWKEEIWVMIQKENDLVKIISAWRYPGKSPEQNPIPPEIIAELKKEGLL